MDFISSGNTKPGIIAGWCQAWQAKCLSRCVSPTCPRRNLQGRTYVSARAGRGIRRSPEIRSLHPMASPRAYTQVRRYESAIPDLSAPTAASG